MKTITNQPYNKYAIPDGEGFTALPIAFITVITRSLATAKQSTMLGEIAPSRPTHLTVTD
jgi:hypothetical protein